MGLFYSIARIAGNHNRVKMSARNFIYQAGHTLFARGLLIPVSILTGIILARYLGPTGKGIAAILLVPPTLACAFGELGIRQATAFLIAKREYDLKDIQASMMALSCITGSIGLSVVLSTYYFLGTFQYGWVINLLFAGTTPIILLRRYATGILLGNQMITQMNYLEILEGIAYLFGILWFVVWCDYGLIGAAIASLIGPSISFLLLLMRISRFAPLRPRWVPPIPLAILKKGISFAASLFIVTLNYRIGVLMLGKLSNENQAGIYSVGSAIAELLWQIPLSIGIVLYSRSMSWSGNDAKRRRQDVFLLSRITLPLTCFTACALLLISSFLIPFFYGVSFIASIDVLRLHLPGAISLSIFFLLHFYASGQGNPHLAIKAFVPGLLLNVALNWYFIPKNGCIGVSLASSISYIVCTALYIYHFINCYGGNLKDILILKKMDLIHCYELASSGNNE